MSLTFDAATHAYTATSDGRRRISVTQTLGGCADLGGWPGVPPWNQIHVPPPGLSQEAWDATLEYKRQIGSAVHHATALDDRGELDEATVAPEIAGYLEAWRRYRIESGFEPFVMELPQVMGGISKVPCIELLVHHPSGFAGTLDRVGRLRDGSYLIPDVKTSSPEHGLDAGPQTAAYELAFRSMYDALPARVARCSVHLAPDGTYRVVPHTTRDDRETFLAAFRLYTHFVSRRR